MMNDGEFINYYKLQEGYISCMKYQHKFGTWLSTFSGLRICAFLFIIETVPPLWPGVSKVDPCGVCGERVGCNSIQCMKCLRGGSLSLF